jgi:hypothetical protein
MAVKKQAKISAIAIAVVALALIGFFVVVPLVSPRAGTGSSTSQEAK